MFCDCSGNFLGLLNGIVWGFKNALSVSLLGILIGMLKEFSGDFLWKNLGGAYGMFNYLE